MSLIEIYRPKNCRISQILHKMKNQVNGKGLPFSLMNVGYALHPTAHCPTGTDAITAYVIRVLIDFYTTSLHLSQQRIADDGGAGLSQTERRIFLAVHYLTYSD